MDYIIIALWGILAGGLLLGGSSKSSKTDQFVQNKEVIQEVIQVVETPAGIVSTPKKTATGEIVTSSYKTDGGMPAVLTQSSHNSSTKGADSEKPSSKVASQTSVSSSSAPASTASAHNESALSFKKGKKAGSASVADQKHKAISFKSGNSAVEVADQTAASRDTVIVFAFTTEDGTVLTPEQLEELARQYDSEQASDISSDFSATGSAAMSSVYTAKEPAELPSLAPGVTLPRGLKAAQLMLDSNGVPVRHVLKRGESLTQLAHLYFADATFWPYIFEVNRFQLSKPDKVQADMRLYLPSPTYYYIDGNDPASVQKAKGVAALCN